MSITEASSNLSKYTHELKCLLKEVVGVFLTAVDISLENTPTSHAVSLALVIYACSDSAMLLLSRACLCNKREAKFTVIHVAVM